MKTIDCVERLKELHASGQPEMARALCEALPCAEAIACQRYLGWFYFEQGDLNRSQSWYSKAAKQGSEEALRDCWKVILRIDASGQKQHAIQLCESQPCSELLDCQRYLAKAYFEKGDIDKTLQWSLEVAKHGDAHDLTYVGLIYRSRNQPELAMKFFERAIAAGSARANHLIGDMYAYGTGVPVDVDKAMSFYAKSAAEGLLYGKARLLHLARVRGGILANVNFLLKLPVHMILGLVIQHRNPNDLRLVDIPSPKGPGKKNPF